MLPGVTNNPAMSNIRTFSHSTPTTINVDRAYTFLAHWTHHFDGIDVKYVGGYSQYHYALHTAAAFLNDNSSITQYQIPLNPGSTCATVLAGFGCGPLTVFPQEAFTYETTTQWSSHEVTFSSTNDGPIQWIAGAYYYWEHDHNPETVEAHSQPQIKQPGSVALGIPLSLPNPSGNAVLLDYEDTIRSRAVYGQIDWKVEKNVKLTIGLRYTHDSKSALEQTRYVGFLDVPSFGLTAGDLGSFMPALDLTTTLTDVNAETAPGAVLPRGVTCVPTLITSGKYIGAWQRCLGDSSAAATGTIGLAWTPDRDTLVYARYNRGYKAFGLDAGYIISVPEAKPEYVNDFEVGFKKTWNRTLQVDADAFYYDYKDDQINIGVPVGGSTGPSTTVTEFINIPKSVSAGVELTANWQPVDHLALSLVYGYNYTQIRSDCHLEAGLPVGSCFVDSADPYGLSPQAHVVAISGGKALQSPKGSELPQAPANKIAFNANYTFVFEPGSLTLSGSYIWKDKSYASIFRRTYDEAPSWHQVDLRATWAGKDDRYEVVLYVRNLFNSLGYDAAAAAGYIISPVGGGPSTQTRYYDLTPPRTYGAEFHVKF
jgi:iron complex outermembrane receptor protein